MALSSVLNSNQRKLIAADLARLQSKTDLLIEDVIEDCDAWFPTGFLYAINKRKSGTTPQYFWRIKSTSHGSRKFLRLDSDELSEYIKEFDDDFRVFIKGVEIKLIIINANLKYIYSTTELLSETDMRST